VKRFVALFLLMSGLLVAGIGYVSAGTTTLVTYPFSPAGNILPSVVGVGVTPTLTLPSNLNSYSVGPDGFGNVLQAYPQTGSTSSVNTVSYYTLSLTTNASGGLGQLTVSFGVGKGGNSDPRGVLARSSLNNYGTDVFSLTLPSGVQAAPAPQSFTVDASGQSAITLRFYVWAPGNGNSVDFSNLSVTTPTPAPSAVPTLSEWSQLLLGLMVISMIGWHFHRERSY